MGKQKNKDYSLNLTGSDKLIASLAKSNRSGTKVLSQLSDSINLINSTKANINYRNRAGLIAEEWHVKTFNEQSARSGADILAELSKYGDRVKDIKITNGNRPIAAAQVKYEQSASRSAIKASKPQYRGTQRILPEEQVPDAIYLLTKSGKSKIKSGSPLKVTKGTERLEAASQIKGSVEAGGIKSRPLKKAEAELLAKGDLRKVETLITKETVKAEAIAGAKAGAFIGGSISTISNAKDFFNGDKSLTDAAKDIATDTMKSAAAGATINLTATAVKTVAPKILGSAGKSIARGSAPVVIAAGILECAVLASKGELNAKKAANVAGSSACAWAGAEGGALIGSVAGPIGTIIGGIVGGLLGSFGFNSIFS